MRNRRSVEIMRCSSQAFGSASMWVAFDAFGDLLFFNRKKKETKNAALMRREAGTAQSALRVARHAPACEVGYIIAVGCETALRAVRDGVCLMVFCAGIFAMASLNDWVTAIGQQLFNLVLSLRVPTNFHNIQGTAQNIPRALECQSMIPAIFPHLPHDRSHPPPVPRQIARPTGD